MTCQPTYQLCASTCGRSTETDIDLVPPIARANISTATCSGTGGDGSVLNAWRGAQPSIRDVASRGCAALVTRPRGHLNGELLDLTNRLIAAGVSPSLSPVERRLALTARLSNASRLIFGALFVERRVASPSRPVAQVDHHEVAAFQLADDADVAGIAARHEVLAYGEVCRAC